MPDGRRRISPGERRARRAQVDDPRVVLDFEPDAGGERVTVGIAGPLAANNSEALREAALAGLGIAMQPEPEVRHRPREKPEAEARHVA